MTGIPQKLWQHAAVYAYYTARPRWVNPLDYGRRIAVARAERRLRADYPHLLPVLSALTPTGSTGCSWIDYVELYEWIRRHRPRWVLECGSGVSTGVIAQALSDNGSGQLISMEESSHYAEAVQSRLPAALATRATVVHSPVVIRTYGAAKGVCYEAVPDHPYDFVFIDGPVAGQHGQAKLFNSDFIHVVSRAVSPVAALLDQRITTLWAFGKMLPGAAIRYYPTRRFARIVAGPADIAPDLKNQLRFS
jgi:hypothetical protein